jgi:NADPH:quinone reductase-like Zn-dependent oxidoreductase
MHEHGGPEVLKLEDCPDPSPGPNDAIVRVRACSVNHLDMWIRQGLPGVKVNLPHILGCDIAGVVESVGMNVHGFQKGDEVFVNPGVSCGSCSMCLAGLDSGCRDYTVIGGYVLDGGYAEFAKVPGKNLIPKPKNLDFLHAAAFPLTFLTAWHMLVGRARIRPGEKVLVLAAGSGIGVAAVQIAKMWGCEVIATAGTEEKRKRAVELGADHVIDHYNQDIFEECKRITNKQGVDVVFEHVGPATIPKGIKSLRRYGRMVFCGATTGPVAEIDLRYVYSRQLELLGSYMGSMGEMKEVTRFLEEGKLKVILDSSMPLADAARAHERLQKKDAFGKIVLVP